MGRTVRSLVAVATASRRAEQLRARSPSEGAPLTKEARRVGQGLREPRRAKQAATAARDSARQVLQAPRRAGRQTLAARRVHSAVLRVDDRCARAVFGIRSHARSTRRAALMARASCAVRS